MALSKDIFDAVALGKLKEPFTAMDVCAIHYAGATWGINTPKTFLAKHCKDDGVSCQRRNSRGCIVYFERVSRGLYKTFECQHSPSC